MNLDDRDRCLPGRRLASAVRVFTGGKKMGEIISYQCDVCKGTIWTDARILMGLTLEATFNQIALEMPPRSLIRYVCPKCYPTVSLAEAIGVKPDDAHFYLV